MSLIGGMVIVELSLAKAEVVEKERGSSGVPGWCLTVTKGVHEPGRDLKFSPGPINLLPASADI